MIVTPTSALTTCSCSREWAGQSTLASRSSRRDGLLRGRLPFSIHPGDELEFDLVPAGDQRFNAGLYRDGKLFNIEMGASFEFDLDGERATTVRLGGIEGTVFGTGMRSG